MQMQMQSDSEPYNQATCSQTYSCASDVEGWETGQCKNCGANGCVQLDLNTPPVEVRSFLYWEPLD